jgi:ElaB/YqjD/DUF883 family membrane-anchored ribosome-binding protein
MTPSTPLHDPLPALADTANRSADEAIRSTQRLAHAALDGLADSAQSLQRDAAPRIGQAADQASLLAHRAIHAAEDAAHQVQQRARHVSDSTVDYIRAEPVKATLIAAGTGAALMGLVWLLSRPRDHR